MNGLQAGPTVMMTLGQFQFGISTAAYQEIERSTEWRWASQDRFMQNPALQYVGPGSDTISLPGVIYPQYRGGFGQVDAMRAMGDAGEPLALIDGNGKVLGQWTIARLREKGEHFGARGMARKIEFTLELTKYSATVQAPARQAISAAGLVVPTLDGMAGLPSFLVQGASTITTVSSGINAALMQASGYAQDLGDLAAGVLGPAQAAAGTATTLLNSLNDAKQLLGMRPTSSSALLSLNKTINAATSAVVNASQAGKSLAGMANQVAGVAAMPQAAVASVRTALTSVNKLTVAATSIQRSASSTLKKLFG